MKKCLILCLGSVISAGAFADAKTLEVFVGGNFAWNTAEWNKYAKDAVEYGLGTKLPTVFLGAGAQIGVKWAPDRIYNTGVSFSYDYMLDSVGEIHSYAKPYVSKLSTGFSVYGLNWDNYIRVSNAENKRSDIVLGLGFGRMTERIHFVPTADGRYYYDFENADVSDWGSSIIIKLGVLSQLTNRWSWFANGRYFLPPQDKGDLEALFNLSLGLNYTF